MRAAVFDVQKSFNLSSNCDGGYILLFTFFPLVKSAPLAKRIATLRLRPHHHYAVVFSLLNATLQFMHCATYDHILGLSN